MLAAGLAVAWLVYLAVRVTREVAIVSPQEIPLTEGALAGLFEGHFVFVESFSSSHNPRGHLCVYGQSSDSRFEAFANQAKLDLQPSGGAGLNHALVEGFTPFLREDDPSFVGKLTASSGRTIRVAGARHRETGETVVTIKF